MRHPTSPDPEGVIAISKDRKFPWEERLMTQKTEEDDAEKYPLLKKPTHIQTAKCWVLLQFGGGGTVGFFLLVFLARVSQIRLFLAALQGAQVPSPVDVRALSLLSQLRVLPACILPSASQFTRIAHVS